MSERVPVYIVGRPDGRLATLSAALGGAVEVVRREDASSLGMRPPGLALIDVDGMGAEELLAVVAGLGGEAWTCAALTAVDPPRLRSLSLGPPDGLGEVAAHVADPGSVPAPLLSLDRALREISRMRHDLNNPLTAAMAEVQLLLMEAPDGEDRDALQTILQQLRRMRDMLAASRHLRPRRE